VIETCRQKKVGGLRKKIVDLIGAGLLRGGHAKFLAPLLLALPHGVDHVGRMRRVHSLLVLAPLPQPMMMMRWRMGVRRTRSSTWVGRTSNTGVEEEG
jgi:hypothetical protein